mmetsp:Transcript_5229/g.7630  ORF Transcript_5229/g.7630 Transcript_5229/m.7630 type:complete len:265 (+) Transcript_5229:106-900(+)
MPTDSPTYIPTINKNMTSFPANIPTVFPSTEIVTLLPTKNLTVYPSTEISTKLPTSPPTSINMKSSIMPVDSPTVFPSSGPFTELPTYSRTNMTVTSFPTHNKKIIPTSETPTELKTSLPTYKTEMVQPTTIPLIGNITLSPTKSPSFSSTGIPTVSSKLKSPNVIAPLFPSSNPSIFPSSEKPTNMSTKIPMPCAGIYNKWICIFSSNYSQIGRKNSKNCNFDNHTFCGANNAPCSKNTDCCFPFKCNQKTKCGLSIKFRYRG